MDTVFPVMNAQSTVPIPTPWSPWRIPMESTSVVVRQHKSNVVFTYLYGLFRISDISLGNVSVGIIGSIQRFASAIPKPIIKNPNAKYEHCLENVIPCSKRQCRKYFIEYKWHRWNRWNSKATLCHQAHSKTVDDQYDAKSQFSREIFFIHDNPLFF